MDKILWTAEEVGDAINYSARKVREKLRYVEDFPVAVVLTKPGQPQWVPEEIRDWVLKQRDPSRSHRNPITRN